MRRAISAARRGRLAARVGALLGGVGLAFLVPGCSSEPCQPGETLPCDCPTGGVGERTCGTSGQGFGPCYCAAPDAGVPDAGDAASVRPDADPPRPDAATGVDAAPAGFCAGRGDGTHCDGSELVSCAAEVEVGRVACTAGCDATGAPGAHTCAGPDPSFCAGKMDGLWCDGNNLVRCESDQVASWETCVAGCQSMPLGTPDQCAPVPFCTTVPPPEEPNPPTEACNYMDWNLSADGFYLISRFGTSNDPTTWGHGTTCGFLQSHYDYNGCRYDVHAGACLDANDQIPWVQGTVDYDYNTVIATVDAYAPGDVPAEEYFYVAGAQRFGCGALLRVSNPANGRCVVVYTEDGGPGTTYEGPNYGGRRILDSSPAVVRYLGVTSWGWANSDLVYVEWGKAGDVPGTHCTPCQSTPAEAGSEAQRSPWDPNHMMSGLDCRQ